ncbi:MAG: DUF3043 domain-containing protein [Candidatus Nanopelagicales bacterium]|nr:DUF3043 domain-containing protein [Candidatus Nanopelagicales bacterium]
MKLFSRGKDDAPAPTTPDTPGQAADRATGKGRPTPTRKEAEAARKHTLKVPSDPKEAKRAAKARAAEERQEARAGLMAGDERYLPARDKGPVRGFVRDFVDSRWAAAELFLPLALVVLLVGFLPIAGIAGYVSMGWMLLTLFILVDTTLLMLRMNRELKRRWPDPAERKGTTLYAVMRVLQLRRLRIPPPRVRPGGRPVKPKEPKPPKPA